MNSGYFLNFKYSISIVLTFELKKTTAEASSLDDLSNIDPSTWIITSDNKKYELSYDGAHSRDIHEHDIVATEVTAKNGGIIK